MIHWPDWTIAGTLCGFDADPMQGRTTVVAQIRPFRDPITGPEWRWAAAESYGWAPTVEDCQRAAAVALASECNCDLRTRLVGDGCPVCQPNAALGEGTT